METMILGIFLALILLALPFVFGPIRIAVRYVLFSIAVIILYFFLYMIGGEFEWETGIPVQTIMVVVILITIVASVFSFITEKKQFENSEFKELDSESFDDERLFYKYGQLIKSDVVPIGASKKTEANIAEISNSLIEDLQTKLREKFDSDLNTFKVNIGKLKIEDTKNKLDSREFLKVEFETIRESKLTCFVNINVIGNQLAINNFQYIRSKYQWFNVMFFIVSAPFHYWLWIYDWVRGKETIDSRLGKYYFENSYDLMDLVCILKTSTFTILKEIESFADKHNLLTEEVKQLIVNNMTNTQNISIEKSKGVRIGRLSIKSNS